MLAVRTGVSPIPVQPQQAISRTEADRYAVFKFDPPIVADDKHTGLANMLFLIPAPDARGIAEPVGHVRRERNHPAIDAFLIFHISPEMPVELATIVGNFDRIARVTKRSATPLEQQLRRATDADARRVSPRSSRNHQKVTLPGSPPSWISTRSSRFSAPV